MNLNIKPYIILIIAIVLLYIIIAVIGNAFVPEGMEKLDKKYIGYIKYFVFSLFFLFCLALVPICLKTYLIGQSKIGNGDLPLVKFLNENTMKAVFGMWLLFISGLVTALPYMIKDGFFAE
jgi:hypothetical protein